MSTRFLASNGVKLLLLLPILFGAPQVVKLLCLLGLLVSLAVDVALYRRDKKTLADDEDPSRHVPMPSQRPEDRRPRRMP
jgi:hypothetical protein